MCSGNSTYSIYPAFIASNDTGSRIQISQVGALPSRCAPIGELGAFRSRGRPLTCPQFDSVSLYECTVLQIGHRLSELLLRVHHDRTVPSYGFLDRLA
jgi:hypothetical protein